MTDGSPSTDVTTAYAWSAMSSARSRPTTARSSRWTTSSTSWAAVAFVASYSSRGTRQAYSTQLRLWFSWCRQHELDPLTEVRRPHVELYARDLEARGLAPATVASKLVVLAGFYRYCVEEQLIEHSPAVHVRRPKVAQESTRLGLDEPSSAPSSSKPDWPAATTTCSPACSPSTHCGSLKPAGRADLTDLALANGHRTLRIVGKGNQPALIPLARADGSRPDRHAAGRIVRRLAERAGIDETSPHLLRHAAITDALDAGGSLRDVQDFARHADPRQTRRYDRARGALDRNPTYIVATAATSLDERIQSRILLPWLQPRCSGSLTAPTLASAARRNVAARPSMRSPQQRCARFARRRWASSWRRRSATMRPSGSMRRCGDIQLADLGEPQGREAGFARPVVIVTAQMVLDQGPSALQVVPLTSRVRGYRSEVTIEPDPDNGLELVSAAQCQHIRAITVERLAAPVGNIGPQALNQMREVLADLLDL